MQVRGSRKYLSIKPFNTIEMPEFSVLIGINGSGKSHFLQAIEEECVVLTWLDEEKNFTPSKIDVLRIENGPAIPGELNAEVQSSITSPNQSFDDNDSERQYFAQALKQFRDSRVNSYKSYLGSISGQNIQNFIPERDVFFYSPEEILQKITDLGGEGNLQQIERAFTGAQTALVEIQIYEDRYIPDPDPNTLARAILEISIKKNKNPLHVDANDIDEWRSWGIFSPFSLNVSKLMSIYRDLKFLNDLACCQKADGEDSHCLSNNDFIELYGIPPWIEISRLLSQLGLPYQVKPPSLIPKNSVSFILENLHDGTPVSFSKLSSGERVLVRFALSILQTDSFRTRIKLPKVLLLDEMDASLHPEMVHRWLGAIQEGLVKALGIKCILTTHSPTTVALSPNDSLYEMTRESNGPRKIEKQQALNRLTFGLPALSVEYDDRRQIFVESATDAIAYQKLSNVLKAEINLPRTLNFMATGPRRGKQEENTGCSVVEHLIETLDKSGNRSIFGLLDWDLKRKSTSRVKILAEGSHYAIENIILNPLLIGILLLRHFSSFMAKHTEIKMSDVNSLNPTQAQKIADVVQNQLGFDEESLRKRVPLECLGGLVVNVIEKYNTNNGHRMEDLLVTKFEMLRRFNTENRGALVNKVIDDVITDYRSLSPKAITDVFREIAEQELGD